MIHGTWLTDAIADSLAAQTVKALLVTSTHTDSNELAVRSEITDELVATGYVAGGVVATGVTAAFSGGVVRLTLNPVNFGAVTATDIAGVVFYLDLGAPELDQLIWTDMTSPVEADGALVYQPVPDGAVQITL